MLAKNRNEFDHAGKSYCVITTFFFLLCYIYYIISCCHFHPVTLMVAAAINFSQRYTVYAKKPFYMQTRRLYLHPIQGHLLHNIDVTCSTSVLHTHFLYILNCVYWHSMEKRVVWSNDLN